jgi:REP element-mobilizing transposase RayT
MGRFPVRKKIRLPMPVYRKGHAFFVTISTFHKYDWFYLHPDLCDLAVKEMRNLASAFKTKVYAWCIMPDHIHFLLQCNNIVNFVRFFKGRMTSEARQLDPKRPLWQRSFYDHALRREEVLSEVSCYIWENPVRAEIVQNPVDYSWSGSEVWPNWRNFYRQKREGGDKPRPYNDRGV